MDDQRKPRGREKKVVGEGKGVEKKGQGLGTGPVNNAGNYEDRKQQYSAPSSPFGGSQQRPQQGSSFGQQRPQQGQGSPFGQQRPQQGQGGMGFPFGQGGQQSGQQQNPFGNRPSSGSQNPFGSGTRPASGSSSSYGTGSGQKQYNSAQRQNGTGTRSTGSGMGGGKLILIVIALVVLLGGGKLGGLFGGDDTDLTGITGTGTGTTTTTTQQTGTGSSGLGDIGNLLSSFLGSSGTSAYDFTGSAGSLLSSLGGYSAGTSQGTTDFSQYFTSTATTSSSSGGGSNTATLDETVSKKARDKYTVVRGNNKDTVTILLYMCGTDLESQQGMATSDLKEMANATVGKKVNLIIYTGGCRRWRNNVISSSVNQIYKISDGKFETIRRTGCA